MGDHLQRGLLKIIDILFGSIAGDCTVLETGERTHLGLMDIGSDIVHGKVETDVSVEVTIIRIRRIAFGGGPYQTCQILITDKAVESVGALYRAVASAVRLVRRQGQGLGGKAYPADVMASEKVLKTGIVTAFGKPESFAHLVEVPVVFHDTGFYLGVDGYVVVLEDRQIGMGCGCCNQLQASGIGQDVECIEDVLLTFVGVEGLVRKHLVPVMDCKTACGLVSGKPVDLLASKFDVLVQIGLEAAVQKLVRKHCTKCGAEGERELEGDVLILQAVHHPEKRQIGFVHGLIEPVLFQELGIFGMSYERKMGIEDEVKPVLSHSSTSSAVLALLRLSTRV